METNSSTQWAIIGVAVVILAIGGTWLVRKSSTNSPVTGDQELFTGSTTPETTPALSEGANNTPKGTTTTTSDGEAVTVVDQKAGTSVTIENMSLTRASWVAIRDDMSILGAAWFPASATSGTVELQRATVAGKTYRAVLYVDDGDKKFDFKTDKLISADSAPIGVSFKAN